MVAVSSLRLMRKRGLIGALLALLFALSLGWPTQLQIPVAGAAPQDWNHDSFWAYPWGKSVVHKGIDIFAPHGSQVVAASAGIVLYQGEIPMGGVVVLILGPQWRLHYYAHLARSLVQSGQLVTQGSALGAVGDSGNAKGKAPGSWQRLNLAAAMSATVWVSSKGTVTVRSTGGPATVLRPESVPATGPR